LKAYFKLNKEILKLNPDIKAAVYLSNHTSVPVLMYGSEIWGTFNPLSSKFNGKEFISVLKDSKCEKLHTKFCKNVLGVHRKATNFGVLSELGRFPQTYNVLSKMLTYWHRLENTDNDIVLNAYLTSKSLYVSNIPSWYGCLNSIIDKIPEIKNLSVKKISIKTFKHHINSLLFIKIVGLERDQHTFETPQTHSIRKVIYH
jgi:hypothetical protein